MHLQETSNTLLLWPILYTSLTPIRLSMWDRISDLIIYWDMYKWRCRVYTHDSNRTWSNTTKNIYFQIEVKGFFLYTNVLVSNKYVGFISHHILTSCKQVDITVWTEMTWLYQSMTRWLHAHKKTTSKRKSAVLFFNL